MARDARPVAARCGIGSSSAVGSRTTLLVARFRYHLQSARAGVGGETLLCEEILPLAYTGRPDAPQWLAPADAERLLAARPDRNLGPSAIDQQLDLLLPALPKLRDALGALAAQRAAAQLAAHERVREAARTRGRVRIEPVLPVDILGAYVLLPSPSHPTPGARS